MDSGFCLSFLASFSANDEDITDETAGFPALERLDLAESSYAFVMTCFWVLCHLTHYSFNSFIIILINTD